MGDQEAEQGATLTVDPDGIDVVVAPGENILAAASNRGWRWPNTCGGQAECSACMFVVVDGRAHLSAMLDTERERLSRNPLVSARPDLEYRLACQTTMTGDAVVLKRGVRQAQAPKSPERTQ